MPDSTATARFRRGTQWQDHLICVRRYPKKPDGDTYPVIDLVLCHGNFLNADHNYVHKNKNVKGFGSYGDIMIRDRKMYVCRRPSTWLKG